MMQTRAEDWPHGMTATATHDTKRGEDARARLLALAELPGEWASAVSRWKILNAPHLVLQDDLRAPSAPAEYMLYQTLLAAWPLEQRDDAFVERIQAYAQKASREGKVETSWLNPHEAYEAGLRTFIARILDRSTSAEFLDSLQTFAQHVALLGALNSLSQITLKATLPGVPDFYQGTEFWDLSLVDPDNRRPVDFTARQSVLSAIEQQDWSQPDWSKLAADWPSGRIKFAWTRQLLKLRTELAEVFTQGDYEPLEVTGAHRDHVIAFARRHGRDAAVVAVGRSLAPLSNAGRAWPGADAWQGSVIAKGYGLEGAGRSGELPLAELFKELPVAVRRATHTRTRRTG
jgi:(1->4)-alpha-D-glucan 1-alpha-D-glucosylmutase